MLMSQDSNACQMKRSQTKKGNKQRASESEEDKPNTQVWMTHLTALKHVNGLLLYLEEQDGDA